MLVGSRRSRRGPLSRAFALWVVALGLSCGVDAPPEGKASQAIVGGSADTTERFGSVFVLKIQRTGGQQNGCTATLITPRTLLTAAHCLPSDVAKVFVTHVTPAPASSPSFVESTDWRRHPSWSSGSPASFDVGVVLLPAASALTPVPYARSDLATLIGKPLTAVGYGLTQPGATDNGTRRFVDLTFRNVTAAHVVLGNAVDKGICFGDSGGPSLHTFPDGITRVVGIHSYTQPSSSCTDGLDTRVDLFGAFIRTWLTDKEGGASCAEDGLCKQGCAPVADPDCVCVADGVCSGACANLLSDPDCPADCLMNGVCANFACPKPDPDCVAELSACTTASQCASRLCTPDPQRSPEQYCTASCSSGGSCAAGTQCVTGACLKPQLPPVGIAPVPKTGCSAAGGSWGALLFALLLRTLRARRTAWLRRSR
ncbi:MAG: putative trypsin precursor [Myxococcaceae bacterium]|nr:putative trypsin precursor [Myxococcaceae bacterium]